jgi:rSAM/selenodomain-associated transferase 2
MGPSVIIPTRNEAQALPSTLSHVLAAWPDAELIVSDGASPDDTVNLAEAAGAHVVRGEAAGRGPQLRAGAEVATRDWLLFLHADTLITPAAARVADTFSLRPEARIATFQLKFDHPDWLLRRSEWWTRFDSVFTRFGDQGILIRRSYYQDLGGFQPWPLFEDVDLLRRARRQRAVSVLDATVTTSARRFRASGSLRQQFSNAFLLCRFLAGGDPFKLAGYYPPADQLRPPQK